MSDQEKSPAKSGPAAEIMNEDSGTIIQGRTTIQISGLGNEGAENFEISRTNSTPGEDGTFVNEKIENIFRNQYGDVLNEQDLRQSVISLAGVHLKQEDVGHCNSPFHSRNVSRYFSLTHEGRRGPNGDICFLCQRRRFNVGLILACCGGLALLGVLKGAWLF